MLAAHLHLNNYAACFSCIWVDYPINISYIYMYIYFLPVSQQFLLCLAVSKML